MKEYPHCTLVGMFLLSESIMERLRISLVRLMIFLSSASCVESGMVNHERHTGAGTRRIVFYLSQ